MSKSKVVVIGGGTGIPVILKSLRQENIDLSAIVTVADDGGSSGRLRSAINIAPPGRLAECSYCHERYAQILCRYSAISF